MLLLRVLATYVPRVILAAGKRCGLRTSPSDDRRLYPTLHQGRFQPCPRLRSGRPPVSLVRQWNMAPLQLKLDASSRLFALQKRLLFYLPRNSTSKRKADPRTARLAATNISPETAPQSPLRALLSAYVSACAHSCSV